MRRFRITQQYSVGLSKEDVLPPSQKHILVALVEDKPGVLNRVASLLRRRNFNIDSIAVGHSAQPKLSRMTIVVEGDNARVEQVRKQLDKLVEIVKIVDITSYDSVIRELALIKVKATHITRSEIIQIVDVFRANIVDVSSDSLVIEVTGDGDKVDSLLVLLRGFGIMEIARTGIIALTRGAGPFLVEDDKVHKQIKPTLASRKAAAAAADW
jgi:acetolactate synthase I/III small subunit